MAKRDRDVFLSKFISKHLRHTPEEIGLTMDSEGWVEIEELIARAGAVGVKFSREELDHIVTSSDKQRFALDAAARKIRANQGHSIPVDLALSPKVPPSILYHGTAVHFLDSILSKGLIRGKRQHVHLSSTPETAQKVGSRHGKPVILSVGSGNMYAAGHIFLLSENGVWLVESVPPEYLSVLTVS